MRAFVNELALAEACAVADPSHAPIQALLKARQHYAILGQALYCARGMPSTNVELGVTLADISRKLPRDQVGLLFQWVGKRGPFIEDDRQAIEEDLFLYDENDVTHLGIGEAARRVLASHSAATLSSVYCTTSRFSLNPLQVTHGLAEDPFQLVDVPNYTGVAALAEKLAATLPVPVNWLELLTLCRSRFDSLHISSYCEHVLARHPYSPAAGRRIQNLLEVLQRLMEEMDGNGKFSATGVELHGRFFVGRRAWFSDESPTRKAAEQTFTFPDPGGNGSLICFWHGKVSTPAFRVHFEWPVVQPSQRLRVVYIGPHL